jgi:hypothetical protein
VHGVENAQECDEPACDIQGGGNYASMQAALVKVADELIPHVESERRVLDVEGLDSQTEDIVERDSLFEDGTYGLE